MRAATSLWIRDNVTPTTNADWRRVVSIRVALVARSNQYEKTAVTTAAPKWDVGGAVQR